MELTLTNLSIDPVSGNLKFNTPPNQFGTNLVTVVMQVWNTGTVGTNTVVMGGTNTFTTTFVLGIAAVDTPPVFTLLTTNYTVSQYDTPLTISHLITGYSSAGTSPWQSTQTVTFAVSTTTAGSNYFSAAPHLVGSNLLFTALNAGAGKTAPVTIVATDSGSPGGVYTSTQTVAFVFPATIYDSYQGTYEGLYYSTTDLGPAAYQSSGFISLTLNADGTIAGYLQNGSGTNGGLNGYTNVWLFTNAFDTVYPDTLETFKTYAPSNYFQLSLSFDSSSMTITGTVANTHPGIDFPAVERDGFQDDQRGPDQLQCGRSRQRQPDQQTTGGGQYRWAKGRQRWRREPDPGHRVLGRWLLDPQRCGRQDVHVWILPTLFGPEWHQYGSSIRVAASSSPTAARPSSCPQTPLSPGSRPPTGATATRPASPTNPR